ncbi:hypothetical protein BLNAU_13030 [Blattamonas nauphoetae]|uniref:Charged multivesicular body protein 7 n=1 Tax=Blattamonas nauphoetae TaxID=2049346 RepID=A0ABQ9XHX7_9EUKA|nr:hypothetical protein BLNAU_13030 [Blattamonas nauphoetae]
MTTLESIHNIIEDWSDDTKMKQMFALVPERRTVSPEIWSEMWEWRLAFWVKTFKDFFEHMQVLTITATEINAVFTKDGISPRNTLDVFNILIHEGILIPQADFESKLSACPSVIHSSSLHLSASGSKPENKGFVSGLFKGAKSILSSSMSWLSNSLSSSKSASITLDTRLIVLPTLTKMSSVFLSSLQAQNSTFADSTIPFSLLKVHSFLNTQPPIVELSTIDWPCLSPISSPPFHFSTSQLLKNEHNPSTILDLITNQLAISNQTTILVDDNSNERYLVLSQVGTPGNGGKEKESMTEAYQIGKLKSALLYVQIREQMLNKQFNLLTDKMKETMKTNKNQAISYTKQRSLVKEAMASNSNAHLALSQAFQKIHEAHTLTEMVKAVEISTSILKSHEVDLADAEEKIDSWQEATEKADELNQILMQGFTGQDDNVDQDELERELDALVLSSQTQAESSRPAPQRTTTITPAHTSPQIQQEAKPQPQQKKKPAAEMEIGF